MNDPDPVTPPLPEELQMATEAIRTETLPSDSVERVIQRAQTIPMTTTAWKRGFINLLLIGGPLYALMFVLTHVITPWMRQGNSLASMAVAAGVLLTIMPVYAYHATITRQRAGAVLVDCGPVPGRGLFLFQTVFMLGIAFWILRFGWTGLNLFLAFGFFAAAAFFANLAFHRTQFCEHGIRTAGAAIAYDQIRVYQWVDGPTPTLNIRTGNRVPGLGRAALPIPAHHRDRVQQILATNIDTASE